MCGVDLSVSIAGVDFKNPIILASGPPTLSAEHIVKCIKAGAAGAVTKTITYDVVQRVQPKPRMFVLNSEDALRNKFYSLYSVDLMSEYEPEKWFDAIRKLKEEVRNQGGVVIASIAGRDLEEWEKLAKLVDSANADMIELNLSCPHIDRGVLMGRAVTSDLRSISEVVRAVKGSAALPVIGKLTPHGANPLDLAKTMVSSGIDAIVSTARFQGLIVDVSTMRPILWGGFGGYGGPWQLPISIGWTAHIAMEGLGVPIIGSGGVSTWEDVIKFILVGASAIQLCTVVMIKGVDVLPEMIENVKRWMAEMGFHNVRDFIGIALKSITPLEKLERRKIYTPHIDKTRCTNCGICVRICPYGALYFEGASRAGVPNIDKAKCDCCGFCASVCPVKAIRLERIE
ncbi:MAG: 4Fe-4S binding protein [Candidatus Bathyarchaeia archaeon]